MLSRREWLASMAGAAVVARLRPAVARSALADKRVVTRMARPFCGEAPLRALPEHWITPVEHFYVLNRSAVPALEPDALDVVVDGAVREPLALPLSALVGRFPRVRVPATLQCAGNRRREHSAARPIDDPLQWGAGAIGNAMWGGVRLRDVLGVARPTAEARHVWFESLDGVSFGGSIPLARVLDRAAPPVLLADEMNGRPLPPAHGYPLRAVVPGAIGARSVKWLARIHVSPRPSDNPLFRRAHRIDDEALQEFPLNGVVCRADDVGGIVRASGYALAPGGAGRRIARVEVSVDGGRRWTRARLRGDERDCCWRLWDAELVAPGAHAVIARAITASGERQPRRAPWNPGGYLYNGWSRLDVHRLPAPR